jgi:hypothetical protein
LIPVWSLLGSGFIACALCTGQLLVWINQNRGPYCC